MKVTFTHEDVIEACREWVERHYGFEAHGIPQIATTLPNNNNVFEAHRLAVTFPECPKPEGGPYRTPG